MKRKTIGAAAAYLSGTFFASFFMEPECVLFTLAFAAAAVFYGRRKSFSAGDFALTAGSFVLSVLMSFAYTAFVFSPALAFDGQTASFEGTVTDCVSCQGGNVLYTLSGRINGDTRAKLTYYTADTGADLGDVIRFGECHLSVPHDNYLFRAETAYKARHIQLIATSAKEREILHNDRFMLRRTLRDIRESLTASLRAETGNDCGSFLAGMIFGEKQNLDDNSRTVLYRTGIGHVLAVSGLHVSIISALLMLLLRKMHVSYRISFAAVNVFMIALIMLANSPVSAVRAAVMLDIMYSARLFLRQNDSLNSLSAAVLIICISDPYCVYSAGFLLSAAGTAGIAVFAPYMTKKMKDETLLQKLGIMLVTAICTTLSVFPLCVFFFDETSLISPFANIILLPLCTCAMALGLLWLVSFGLIPVSGIAAGLIKLIIRISEAVSSVGALHIADTSGILRILLISAALSVIIVHIIRRSSRTTAILTSSGMALFCVISLVSGYASRRAFRAAVLGSGDDHAVVVTHGGYADIIDLSGHYSTADHVRKYLLVNGIGSADMLILTKNVQSQYSAYVKGLELFPGYFSAAAGETEIYCGDAQIFGDGAVHAESRGCLIDYDGGALTVTYRGKELSLVPADEKGSGLMIHCSERTGLIPEREIPAENKEGLFPVTNGYEIVMTGKEYKVRRL